MDENPPAFPQRQFDSFGHADDQAGFEGMSLRDYFAGQALIGLCHAEPWTYSGNKAEMAYEVANAMLAVRALLSEEQKS